MAKTKAKPKTQPKASPPAPKGAPIAVTVRGSEEWKGWVERGTEHCRLDTAKVIDAALIEFFRSRGFTEEAPKR